MNLGPDLGQYFCRNTELKNS